MEQRRLRHSERIVNQVNPFSWNEQKNSTSYAAEKMNIPSSICLRLEQKGLKLPVCQRRFDAGDKLGEIGDHRGRLVKSVVLTHGDKKDIFAVEKSPDIFSSICECIIGRDCQHDRARIPQMCLDRQCDAGVGDSVCQLSQCVSGAGGDHHDIQQLLGTDGFSLDNGVENLVSADGLDALAECLCLTKTGVCLVGIGGHNRDNFPVWVGSYLLQLSDDLLKGTEGAG